MKINSMLKIISGVSIYVLAVGVEASSKKAKSNFSCGVTILLSELELNAEFKTKLDLIKRAGWKLTFDTNIERVGFLDDSAEITEEKLADLEVATMIEGEINDLKELYKPPDFS